MHSDSIELLAIALSKAQSKIKGAAKQADNSFFKTKYADLASVWESCGEALSENGLSVVQTTERAEGQYMLVTMLLHSSGQWIKGFYPINPMKADPQAFGSAVTYARRYALAAIVGVYSIEDDDGERGMDRKSFPLSTSGFKPVKEPSKAAAKPTSTQAQMPGVGPGAEKKNYIVTFGEAKGLPIDKLPREAIDKYCQKILDKAAVLGTGITGEAKDFMDAAAAHLGAKNISQVQEMVSDARPY